MKLVKSKLKISGHHVNYYNYQNPIILGTRKNSKSSKKRDKRDNRIASISNARNRLIDIVRCNKDLRHFITITYAKAGLSLLESNINFRVFIKKIKRKYPNFSYIAIPELQNKRFKLRNEFAIHYHLLWNLDLKAEYIAKLWGHGFIFSKTLEGQSDYSAFYIAKYLTKDFLDEVRKIKPNNCQYYYSSRGLNRPEKIYGYDADIAKKLLEDKIKLVKQTSYKSLRLGEINSKQYVVDRPVDMSNIKLTLEDLTNAKKTAIIWNKPNKQTKKQLKLKL